jgi:hypothetical protein
VFKAEARRSEGDRACFDSEGEHVIGLVYEEGFCVLQTGCSDGMAKWK